MRKALLLLTCLCGLAGTRAQDAGDRPAAEPAPKPGPEVRAALEKLRLPGIKINLEERCIDVASEVCLDEGTLELVACTRDSKEHESIVSIDAQPMHIHTALLLLGAKSGNPAMRKRADEDRSRWIDVPPSGGPVDVSLVFENKEGKLIEQPISDFIEPADPAGIDADGKEGQRKRFPTHTFLFAGSRLLAQGAGPPAYLCDRSGNVISIATFGDELLCLPEVHSHKNGALLWQIDSRELPKVGTKLTLRLRPRPTK